MTKQETMRFQSGEKINEYNVVEIKDGKLFKARIKQEPQMICPDWKTCKERGIGSPSDGDRYSPPSYWHCDQHEENAFCKIHILYGKFRCPACIPVEPEPTCPDCNSTGINPFKFPDAICPCGHPKSEHIGTYNCQHKDSEGYFTCMSYHCSTPAEPEVVEKHCTNTDECLVTNCDNQYPDCATPTMPLIARLYRKKPVVIEAMQFDGTPKAFEVVGMFCGQAAIYVEVDHVQSVAIKTLEGTSYNVTKGDWIIKGIKGEFYPCKPDIFQATYEPCKENPIVGISEKYYEELKAWLPAHDQLVRKEFAEECIKSMPKVMTADDSTYEHTNQKIQRDEDIAHIREMATEEGR